jgi:hypothetical protein
MSLEPELEEAIPDHEWIPVSLWPEKALDNLRDLDSLTTFIPLLKDGPPGDRTHAVFIDFLRAAQLNLRAETARLVLAAHKMTIPEEPDGDDAAPDAGGAKPGGAEPGDS